MGYQVILKQYKGSVPIKEEQWKPDDRAESQMKEFSAFPLRISFIKEKQEESEKLILQAEMREDFGEPVSVALEYEKDCWKKTEYVFMPGAVYDGNRMKSIKIPYPPYHAGMTDGKWSPFITDIPHLDREKQESQGSSSECVE